jgi:hypothetical protein
MYNEHNCPGYGDSETWGRILDSRDPRYSEADYDEYDEGDEDYFDEPDEEDDLDSDDDYYYGD